MSLESVLALDNNDLDILLVCDYQSYKLGVIIVAFCFVIGFEILEKNSFEQICINYCNEILQSHFNYVVFTAEKELYAMEGIICEAIESKDNIIIIKEIEGMFKNLDDEGKLPKGSSRAWYDKAKKNSKSSSSITFIQKRETFVITHYAAKVEYYAEGFLEKNMETLTNELINAMMNSSDAVLNKLFGVQSSGIDTTNEEPVLGTSTSMQNLQSPMVSTIPSSTSQAQRRLSSKRYSFTEDNSNNPSDSSGTVDLVPTQLFSDDSVPNTPQPVKRAPMNRMKTMSALQINADISDNQDILSPLPSSNATPHHPGMMQRSASVRVSTPSMNAAATPSVQSSRTQSMNTKTLSWTFKNQLSSLMEILRQSENHFIRCVKSNTNNSPFVYDSKLINSQLAYSGVYEVVKIQQSGLPCRVSFQEFLQRYKCLAPSKMRHRFKAPSELIDFLRPYFVSIAMARFGNNSNKVSSPGGLIRSGSLSGSKLQASIAPQSSDFSISDIDPMYLLGTCQQGKTMVFMKSSEQNLLEITRKNLLSKSAVIIQKYIRRKLYYRIYRSLRLDLRQFDYFLSQYDLIQSEIIYQNIVISCDHYNILQRRVVLGHIANGLAKDLETLRQQVLLLQQFEALFRSTTNVYNSLIVLQALLPKAIEYNLSENELVKEISNCIHRFGIAKNMVEQMMNDTEYMMTCSKNELDHGLNAIKEFESIIPEANYVYDRLTNYMIQVDYEIKQIFEPLQQVFHENFVYYDESTCVLCPRYEGLEANHESLATLIGKYSIHRETFLCQDTKILYDECCAFLRLRDEYVQEEDHQGVLDYLESGEIKALIGRGTNEFREQLKEFQSWADLEVSITSAQSALNLCMIPRKFSEDTGELGGYCYSIRSLIV